MYNMTLPGWKNKLYFGDNLDILREHVASESVDLIYLAPPFKSRISPLIRGKSPQEVGGRLCHD
jgi:16S rRNA G966 N2-methylase RsmD